MQRATFLALLLPTLLISACASTPPVETPAPIVRTEIITPYIQTQPRPRPVELANVTWRVVNQDNLEEFLTSIKLGGSDFVFVAISVKDYERLSLNTQELRRYILQQKELIVFYEQAIAENNSLSN